MKLPQVDVLATDNVITVISDGKVAMIRKGETSFPKILKALKDGRIKEIPKLLITPDNIKTISKGRITVKDGEVFYKGETLKHPVVEKIKQFIGDSLPFESLLAFLNKLLANPSKQSIEELYSFLENKHLPITQTGNFLAYKKVNDNFMDFHSGKYENKVGASFAMLRGRVDDNHTNYCSAGFHVGSIQYADREFYPGQGRIVIVEVDPQHAVSVPSDHSRQKLRVYKYKVVAEYKGALDQNEEILSNTLRASIKRISQLRKAKKGRIYIVNALEKTEPGTLDKIKNLNPKLLPRRNKADVKWLLA